MRFIYSGTIEKLKETIYTKSQDLNKDIVVYHDEPTTLQIGYQRLGHSNGRFFVANVTDENGNVILSGEPKDIDSYHTDSKFKKFVNDIGDWLIIYSVLEIIPFIVWFCLFQLTHIWIPIILPIPIIIFCRILKNHRDKKSYKKIDAEFVEFMSIFSKYEATNE